MARHLTVVALLIAASTSLVAQVQPTPPVTPRTAPQPAPQPGTASEAQMLASIQAAVRMVEAEALLRFVHYPTPEMHDTLLNVLRASTIWMRKETDRFSPRPCPDGRPHLASTCWPKPFMNWPEPPPGWSDRQVLGLPPLPDFTRPAPAMTPTP
jgi:hypothetical protein